MMSKRLAGRKGKVLAKKSKISPPKRPANIVTVASLFKKQQLQQEAREQRGSDGGDPESEEAVAFIKEEQTSPYFIRDKKLQNSSTSTQSQVDDEGDFTRAGKSDCHAIPGMQRRLSRRLSLKKACQERNDREKSGSLRSTPSGRADSQGDDSALCSVQESKTAKFCQKAEDPKARGAETVSAHGIAVKPEVIEGSGPCLLEHGSRHGFGKHRGSSLKKGRLSLKRKKKSEADGSVSLSPHKKSNSLPKPPSEQQISCGRSIFEEENVSTSSSAVSFSQALASEQLESPTASTSHSVSASENLKSATTLTYCLESVLENPASLTVPTPHMQMFVSEASKSSTAPSSYSVLVSEHLTSPAASASHSVYVSEGLKSPIASAPKTQRAFRSGISNSQSASRLETYEENKCASEDHGVGGDNPKRTDSAENESDENSEETVYRVPYYLENFNAIMKSVFEDDYNVKLFDETDLKHLTAYNNLSEISQKLYVRLFSRKLAWLSTSKIKYPEIAQDLAPCLEELTTAGLLSSGEDLDDLALVLRAMSAPDLRTLAKSYHFNPMGQQKGQIILALVAKSQQSTVASLFGQKVGGVRTAMLKRAKKMLGPMYRLTKEPRTVFVRAMMLFSLISTNGDEESGNGGQGQLFQMLRVNMGRVVYPTYTVNRQTQIFSCRQDLIRFEEALQLETELLGCTGSGNWKGAYSAFLMVKERYDELVKDNHVTDWDSHLPDFLRFYTAGSVLVRLLSQGIEILQRRKDYTAAVTLIRKLLSQHIYDLDLRGYWWDRLALNLDVHLKQQEQALQAIGSGLADSLVRTGHRLSLFLRAEAICSKPKSPFSKRLKEFPHEPLAELPKVYIEGRVLHCTLPGCRYQFITEASYAAGNSEEVTMCNVEQIVLDHYRTNGFPKGIHAEGSLVSILFCLYFWDVLFMDVADAFHSPFQTTPFDFCTDAFHLRRQNCIDSRLSVIGESSEESLQQMLAETWEKQNGVMCAGMNWEKFTSVGEVQGLVSCMGGKVLAGILSRYAQQPRHTRGGFPDLTLWNTVTRQLKISEVKGPGDRLSHKQMMWLDYLLKLGVDAEVCHVKPVGVKKLKPVSKA